MIVLSRLLYLVITILILQGCKKNSDYSESQQKVKKGFLSNVFEFKKTLLLKDKDNMVYMPWALKKYDDSSIFITEQINRNSIKRFNSQGKCILDINSLGQGPEEFMSIKNFEVVENKIIIYDIVNNKILIFDLSGKFLSTFLLPEVYKKMCYIKDNSNSLALLKYGENINTDVIDFFNFYGQRTNSIKINYSEFSKRRKLTCRLGEESQLIYKDNILFFIGCDEYKLVKYNLLTKVKEAIQLDIPAFIKNLMNLNEIKKFPGIWNLTILKNNDILLEIKDYFLKFDKGGNYLEKISKPKNTIDIIRRINSFSFDKHLVLTQYTNEAIKIDIYEEK